MKQSCDWFVVSACRFHNNAGVWLHAKYIQREARQLNIRMLHFIWCCNKLSTGLHSSYHALALRNIDSNYGHSFSSQFEFAMASAFYLLLVQSPE